MSTKAQVWIVWSPNGNLENIYTLTYHDGSSRVYNRDNYDSRVDLARAEGEHAPYFRHTRDALAFLCANPGKECQVDIRTNLFAD